MDQNKIKELYNIFTTPDGEMLWKTYENKIYTVFQDKNKLKQFSVIFKDMLNFIVRNKISSENLTKDKETGIMELYKDLYIIFDVLSKKVDKL